MLYSVFNEHHCILERSSDPLFRAGGCLLVGLDGLEPSTSRLSGARSSHLSYRPLYSSVVVVRVHLWWRWRESNPWPPACRAGALPAELHPRLGFWRSMISKNWTARSECCKHRTLVNGYLLYSEYGRFPQDSSRFSIERRWSSRTFRYGYLVTT